MKFKVGHRYLDKLDQVLVWRTANTGPYGNFGPYVWQPFKDKATEYSQERAAGIVATMMEDLKEGDSLIVERS